MILEEETKEAYRYLPSELKPRSSKLILAACDGCGKVRETTKDAYRPLCPKCAGTGDRARGRKSVECVCMNCQIDFKSNQWRIDRGGGKFCSRECAFAFNRDEQSPKYIKRIKCLCQYCGIEFEVEQWRIKKGNVKFCTHKCYGMSLIGREAPNKLSIEERKSRRRHTKSKTKAKRKQLGYKLLMPLKEGEEGHHITDEYVIGIPKDVHQSIGGNRRKHRTLVLQWLKTHNKKKYKKVLCVLAQQPL